MANGQRDVNVPLSLVPLGDSLLVALEHFLKTVGFKPKRMPKKDGNHLCDWWLYCTLRDAAPTQSQVVFGITKFQKVNKVTHLYCRGKDQKRGYLTTGVRLLNDFLVACPRMVAAVADWDSSEYGSDYLNLARGDMLLPCAPVPAVDAEGWSYAMHAPTGRCGWYPPAYAQ